MSDTKSSKNLGVWLGPGGQGDIAELKIIGIAGLAYADGMHRHSGGSE
jgi:hypothetical protein